MTKSQLIQTLMERSNIFSQQDAKTIKVRSYQSYQGRNPRTGDKVEVAPKKLPHFKVGKELKERVENPTSG